MKTIKVELNNEDAELFKFIMKYRHIFEKAKTDCCPGSLVLHFDQDFNIKKTEYHQYAKEAQSY